MSGWELEMIKKLLNKIFRRKTNTVTPNPTVYVGGADYSTDLSNPLNIASPLNPIYPTIYSEPTTPSHNHDHGDTGGHSGSSYDGGSYDSGGSDYSGGISSDSSGGDY